MMNEKLTIILAAGTIIIQVGTALLMGGFSTGEKLTRIEDDIKSLRSELVAQNKLSSHRLSVVERRLNI